MVLIGSACQDSMGNVARNAREPGRTAAYLAGPRSLGFRLGGTSAGRAAGAGSGVSGPLVGAPRALHEAHQILYLIE